ncbi:hypothetical protein E1262_25805 [Jiangella aurantiaca]|uniref:Uncharacterized protein n=1 Tax=Jiangella aurantiaca TaxID=2530373 RepID=A0A4R5A6U1_9ACTN|nr:hypothetical protein [Jiangella aurantiaca]TDD65282.1 hypothetical protein E1262_25805 [Jiangella aurantiaca]
MTGITRRKDRRCFPVWTTPPPLPRSDGSTTRRRSGSARSVVEPGPLTGDEADRYIAKYRATIEPVGARPEDVLDDYSTVIRVTPTRARVY